MAAPTGQPGWDRNLVVDQHAPMRLRTHYYSILQGLLGSHSPIHVIFFVLYSKLVLPLYFSYNGYTGSVCQNSRELVPAHMRCQDQFCSQR
jgi:hypothetical protein